MKTQDVVIRKVKDWLDVEGKSYQWLADELGLSKSMVGHLMSGSRMLQPHHIEQISKILNVELVDLLKRDSEEEELTIQLRGITSNRRSKRELDSLLFAIKDYIGLKDQVIK